MNRMQWGCLQETEPVQSTQWWVFTVWGWANEEHRIFIPHPHLWGLLTPALSLLILQGTSVLPASSFLGLLLNDEQLKLDLPGQKRDLLIRSSVLTLKCGWWSFCEMIYWPKCKTGPAESSFFRLHLRLGLLAFSLHASAGRFSHRPPAWWPRWGWQG